MVDKVTIPLKDTNLTLVKHTSHGLWHNFDRITVCKSNAFSPRVEIIFMHSGRASAVSLDVYTRDIPIFAAALDQIADCLRKHLECLQQQDPDEIPF